MKKTKIIETYILKKNWWKGEAKAPNGIHQKPGENKIEAVVVFYRNNQ